MVLTEEDKKRAAPGPNVGLDLPIEERSGRFWRKVKEAPLVPIGVTGGIAALLTSIVAFRRKSENMKTSVYLIHTRMAVQGIIIGTLTGGMVYHLWKDHVGPYIRGESKRL